jgi:predicted nucleic acid-binding protein
LNIVVDASAVAAWLMPDEKGIDLTLLQDRGDILIAPWLLWVELRNLVLMSIRRNRLSRGTATRVLTNADALGVRLDAEPHSLVLMDLAEQHRLTAYDALYLELALRTSASLLSADKALCKAAQSESVTVLGWQM